MPQSLSTLIAIPELALMLSQYLRHRDYCRLCLTSKPFREVFQPLVGRNFDYNDRKRSCPFLANNQDHLRNLSVTLNGEHYFAPHDYTLPIYILLFGPEAQEIALERDGLDTDEVESTIVKNNNTDHNSQERKCTNLRKFDFRMDLPYDYSPQYGHWTDMARLFLKDVMRLNIRLTDLSLNTRLVIGFVDEFLKAFFSLVQLKSLTVAMCMADEPTHPRALEMLLKLGQHHPSLESIDFANINGGGRPCITFRPDHMTLKEELELDRRDEKHDEEEHELIETIQERFKKTPMSSSSSDHDDDTDAGCVTFPRIRELALPPRRYHEYPESFLEALRREGVVPNLSSLIAPLGAPFWLIQQCHDLKSLRWTTYASRGQGSGDYVVMSILANAVQSKRHCQTLETILLPYQVFHLKDFRILVGGMFRLTEVDLDYTNFGPSA
ncbi:hypothetical protein BGZ83_009415 [Gryganskiella cystojenkinii]|nr:hypothetical protein BGZ83_009415 [Gryganskiella cystojenkinii]